MTNWKMKCVLEDEFASGIGDDEVGALAGLATESVIGDDE
jgi:hypothetical protein